VGLETTGRLWPAASFYVAADILLLVRRPLGATKVCINHLSGAPRRSRFTRPIPDRQDGDFRILGPVQFARRCVERRNAQIAVLRVWGAPCGAQVEAINNRARIIAIWPRMQRTTDRFFVAQTSMPAFNFLVELIR